MSSVDGHFTTLTSAAPDADNRIVGNDQDFMGTSGAPGRPARTGHRSSPLDRRLTVVALLAAAVLTSTGYRSCSFLSPEYAAPRTAWGDPDLQGVWDLATLTPLEPSLTESRRLLTKKEADAIAREESEKVARREGPGDPNRTAPEAGVGPSEDSAFFESGISNFKVDGHYPTSIVVVPADGRVPPHTPEARARNARARGTYVAPSSDTDKNPPPFSSLTDIELRSIDERCLLGFHSTTGPPTLPNYYYNNFTQIVQTPDHVMILVEMVHDARIVRLNSDHVPSGIRNWLGDSIGRWEGDTLVVETTNFNNKVRFRGSSENMKVVERFRRVDEQRILYRFTIEDPATWPQPWTGEYPWVASNEQIFEYACHEGNYSLPAILRGMWLQDLDEVARVFQATGRR